MGFLAGKKVLITGLLSNRSIAYGIAKACHREGAELAFTYAGDRSCDRVHSFAEEFGSELVFKMDVSSDEEIQSAVEGIGNAWGALDGVVHSIGFAPREAIAGDFLEGLSRENVLDGPVPRRLELPENGCTFTAPLLDGQKTGWFYDQRANRQEAARYAHGADVLDIFCYAGGFGATAAACGARSVTFLDASPQAVELAGANAARNAPHLTGDGIRTLCGDAFDLLRELHDSGRRFSLICLDPPAFIKRRKDAAQGLAAYRKINALALQLLSPGGVIASCSCSHHLPAEELRHCLSLAAARQKTALRLLFAGGQGPDHPVHAAMPETAYLKCFIAQRAD